MQLGVTPMSTVLPVMATATVRQEATTETSLPYLLRQLASWLRRVKDSEVSGRARVGIDGRLPSVPPKTFAVF